MLFIERSFERLEFVLFPHAPFPPGFDEAKAVAHQLDEGGGDGQYAHPQTPVLDAGVDTDNDTI